MPKKENNDDSRTYNISLRDVLIIVAAVVSVAGAWGVYGTRISVMENNIIAMRNDINEMKQITKEVKRIKDVMDRKILRLEFEIKSIKNNN